MNSVVESIANITSYIIQISDKIASNYSLQLSFGSDDNDQMNTAMILNIIKN